ncbi:MAG: putative glycoside hydrolase, partial [Patescibacteria group bacterium]
MMKKIFIFIFIFFLCVAFQPTVLAFDIKDEYPKLANCYLQPFVPSEHYNKLAKYDLVILDVDTQTITPALFDNLKSKNPEIKILAYIPSQSVNVRDLDEWAHFRKIIYNQINFKNWWLKDSKGNFIYFPDAWPFIRFIDIGNGWSEYMTSIIKDDVISRDIWDGIFYDMVFSNLSWLNDGDIDINKDGAKDDKNYIDDKWQKEMAELFQKTREKIGNKIILINGDSLDLFQQNINGRMFETFPTPWEGNGKWEATMEQYLEKLPLKNASPQIYILNSNTDNTGAMDNYRKVRFGLTSALLGNGYFSFDFGDKNHGQVWWYDEYDIKLGKAKSTAYNLLDKNNKTIKPGLWRRDFSNGIAVVNSTDKEQKYGFYREEFEKINGSQDRRVNDGSKINWVKITPNDGIVLLKINMEIKNSSFKNGNFVRVFNNNGDQARNGFFSYNDNFQGDVLILTSDIDDDKDSEILVNEKGAISIYDNGVKTVNFTPYGALFKNEISFAVADLDNDGTKEIITVPATNGGSHVKIFSKDGKLLNPGWFAYDKNFRGGVSIAVADLDNDGTKEIITVPA